MKNRQWDKLTTDRCKQFCNNWCCPCNDGSIGCYANDFFENLCENSSLAYIYREEEDKFDKLQEESYDKLIESYDDPEVYEEFCARFVDELCEKPEEEYEPMPICNNKNAVMPYETPKVNWTIDDYIPIEWLKKWAETNSNGEWSVEYRTVFNGILKDWKKEKSVKISEGNYDSDEEYEEQMRCLNETNRCE